MPALQGIIQDAVKGLPTIQSIPIQATAEGAALIAESVVTVSFAASEGSGTSK